MKPEAIASINDVLDASKNVDPDEGIGVLRFEDAVDAWRAQGCPMVTVPGRDALLAVATTIECESMPYGIFGDDMIDDWHGKRKTVATFLRTIAGDEEATDATE